MKKIIFNSIIALSVIIAIQSCKPDPIPAFKGTGTVTSGFAGTWKLTKVTQIDDVASSKGFPFTTMDITNVFPYSDFSLTLNMSSATPTTFSTIQGNSPKVIPISSGNWAFDNPDYPSVLTLQGATDTLHVNLSSYPSATSANLSIVVDKYDAVSGTKLISYNYLFTKQ